MVTRRELFAIRNMLSENPGNAFYVRGSGNDGLSGLEFSGAKRSIGDAIDDAEDGDILFVDRGAYDEATITVDKAVTIKGIGGRGAPYIEPGTSAVEGMLVTSDDVTLINLGVAGDDTADYALQVGSQTVSPARFRATGCKFELADGAGAAVILKGAGDVRLLDCEFAWAASGLLFDDNDDGYCTQVFAKGNDFHNLATVGVGVATSGLVKNLNLIDNVFDNKEDGTAPTDYVLLSSNDNTGVIARNVFATATNATGVLTIGSGLKWVSNHTEAGESVARPA